MFTARRILLVLIPAAILIFFSSLFISSTFFHPGRPFKLSDAVISSLQSPEDNPHGYLTACAGTAVSAILFLPIPAFFFRALALRHRDIAIAGSLLYTLGLLAAILIGCLAPFPSVYEPVHLPMAYAAYILMFTGLLICLSLASYRRIRSGGISGIAMLFLLAGLLAIVLYLFYLVVGPDSNNVAFIEWILSAGVAAYSAVVTLVLSRSTR